MNVLLTYWHVVFVHETVLGFKIWLTLTVLSPNIHLPNFRKFLEVCYAQLNDNGNHNIIIINNKSIVIIIIILCIFHYLWVYPLFLALDPDCPFSYLLKPPNISHKAFSVHKFCRRSGEKKQSWEWGNMTS